MCHTIYHPQLLWVELNVHTACLKLSQPWLGLKVNYITHAIHLVSITHVITHMKQPS